MVEEVVSEKKVHKLVSEGSLLGISEPKLTPNEKEVLNYLENEFLTPKQISNRRKTSVRAVYKIINSLKKKGFFSSKTRRFTKTRCTIEPYINQSVSANTNTSDGKHKIRLHGQEFNIDILFHDEYYNALRTKNNIIEIDNNTTRLYKNSIEVYSNKDFYAKTPQIAYSDSLNYWRTFFTRLENELKITLIKPKKHNIKEVKAHYSEVNNELSKDCEEKGERISILATEDKKVWGFTDNSLKLHEFETIHPETSKADMQETIQPFFNDLRDNKPPLPSELTKIIMLQSKNIDKTLQVQAELSANIKLHLKVLRKLGKAVDWVNEEKKYIRKVKGQKTLSDF